MSVRAETQDGRGGQDEHPTLLSARNRESDRPTPLVNDRTTEKIGAENGTVPGKSPVGLLGTRVAVTLSA